MSERLTPERLAEIRNSRSGLAFFPQASQDLQELLAHIDAQQAEIDRLGILLDDEYRHQFSRERDRKLRLEGARELVKRAIEQHFNLTDEYAYAQAPDFWMDRLREALAVQENLADMEAGE